VTAAALVLRTVHRALDEADREQAHPGISQQRQDAEAAVRETPGVPEEAILAEEAFIGDRVFGGGPVGDGSMDDGLVEDGDAAERSR
jgi:hypothetical protein